VSFERSMRSADEEANPSKQEYEGVSRQICRSDVRKNGSFFSLFFAGKMNHRRHRTFPSPSRQLRCHRQLVVIVAVLLSLCLCLVDRVGASDDADSTSSTSSTASRSDLSSLNGQWLAATTVLELQAVIKSKEEDASGNSPPLDVNVRDDRSGQTALMHAVLMGRDSVVEFLLQSVPGIDVTIPERDGYTPAHGAGFQGRANIMRILHEASTPTRPIDVLYNSDVGRHRDGFLPFHRACWGREQRHTDTVQYLLEIGMDVNAPASGKTCWEMSPNEATKRVLREHGAAVSESEL
jgi:Ankyrin repeat